jgi:hypothetical protein
VFVWLGDVAYIDNMRLPGVWFPEKNLDKARLKFNVTKYDLRK